MPTVRIIAGLLVAVAFDLSISASAQTTPVRMRGAITAIDCKTVTVTARDGTVASVKLADNWTVGLIVPASMSDIKQGTFVGIASTGTDTDRTALEVLVFRMPCAAPARDITLGTCSRRA